MRLSRTITAQIDSPIGSLDRLRAMAPDGVQLLDASQGAPNYPPPPAVVQRMAAIAQEPDGSRYTTRPGIDSVRKLIASDLNELYSADLQPEQILITAGCNQAFCVTVSALAEPGDEVLLHTPFYFNHHMWLGIQGVRPVCFATDDAYFPSLQDAAAKITPNTRAIVLVTPGNPTGATVPPALIAQFYQLAAEHDVALVIDETYKFFGSAGKSPHELLAQHGWTDHLVSLHSFSKEFAIPGCRVGAVVAGVPLIREASKAFDCVAICAPKLGQEAVAAGLAHADEWRKAKSHEMSVKLERFRTALQREPGGYVLASSGAFFGWVRHPYARSANEVVEALVKESSILSLPGSTFGSDDPRAMRFSFANLSLEEIDELGDRLARGLDGE